MPDKRHRHTPDQQATQRTRYKPQSRRLSLTIHAGNGGLCLLAIFKQNKTVAQSATCRHGSTEGHNKVNDLWLLLCHRYGKANLLPDQGPFCMTESAQRVRRALPVPGLMFAAGRLHTGCCHQRTMAKVWVAQLRVRHEAQTRRCRCRYRCRCREGTTERSTTRKMSIDPSHHSMRRHPSSTVSGCCDEGCEAVGDGSELTAVDSTGLSSVSSASTMEDP